MLRLVLLFLMAYLTSVILADCHKKPPTVLIDGDTAKEKFDSSVALPLGTTLVLTCGQSGIPQNLTHTIEYNWTCPNGPCEQREYAGRMIKNNTLAINIISKRDNGTYICTVSAEGCKDGSGDFNLNVTDGKVVHSYGRLILNESVISDRQQLQPPNHPRGGGKIECRVSSGMACFNYFGRKGTLDMVKQRRDCAPNISVTDVDIVPKALRRPNKFAIEGYCAGLYHYLFLRKDPNCCSLPKDDVNIKWSSTSITVTINKLPDGIKRAIVGYTRLDLGVPVEGEYMNLRACEPRTFSPLVSGTKYRITAWGLSGGDTDDRKRCWSPTVIEDSTPPQLLFASPPRGLTGILSAAGGMEWNWMPPRFPNGDIMGYNFKYMRSGTEIRVNTTTNYYTLEDGQNCANFTVMAINGAGYGEESEMIKQIPSHDITSQ